MKSTKLRKAGVLEFLESSSDNDGKNDSSFGALTKWSEVEDLRKEAQLLCLPFAVALYCCSFLCCLVMVRNFLRCNRARFSSVVIV